MFRKLMNWFKRRKPRKLNPFLSRINNNNQLVSIPLQLPLMQTDKGFTRSAMTFDSDKSKQAVQRTLESSVNNELYTTKDIYDVLLSDNKFLGFPLLAMLSSQVGLIESACGALSGDMCREWIEVITVGSDDKSEKLKQIDDALVDFGVRDKFERAAFMTFGQGGCMMYISLSGQDDINDYGNAQRAEPLYIDNLQIGKGDLLGFQLIEPIRCTPILQNTSNPFRYDFYNPQNYLVMGYPTHRSRMLKFIERELPEILRPMYAYFGISLTQRILSYIMTAEDTRKEVAKLVKRCNLNLIGTNLEGILESTGNDDLDFEAALQFHNRIQQFIEGRNNYGVLAYDKESEIFEQITTSLAELDDILSKMYELTACIHRIPLTKWLGQSASGMNATGEGDMKNYYDVIALHQKNIFKANLDIVLKVIQLHLFGEIDEDIQYKFVPLEQLNELEQAQVNEAKARVDVAYQQVGAVSPQEIAERISEDPKSGYGHIDVSSVDDDVMNNEKPLSEQQQSNPLKI